MLTSKRAIVVLPFSCGNVFGLQHTVLLLLNQLGDSFQLASLRGLKRISPRNIAEGKPEVLLPMASRENMGAQILLALTSVTFFLHIS